MLMLKGLDSPLLIGKDMFIDRVNRKAFICHAGMRNNQLGISSDILYNHYCYPHIQARIVLECKVARIGKIMYLTLLDRGDYLWVVEIDNRTQNDRPHVRQWNTYTHSNIGILMLEIT